MNDIILWATTQATFDPARLAGHPDARDVIATFTDDRTAHSCAAEMQADGWRVRLLRCIAEYTP